jgi:large subunit ribosomal protein L9
MKVILLQELENLGREGDLVEGKSGYARNYLLPRKLAVEANKGNMSQIEALKKKRAIREAKELEEAKVLQGKIDGLILEFSKKAGKTGKLYGSVTSREIAEKISQTIGVDVDRKYLELGESLKEIGEYPVKVNLVKGFTLRLK